MNPASDTTPIRAGALLACLLVVTAAVYWAGLQGPFLLDDNANLQSIPQWLDGQLGLASLVFDRGAGMLGRPVAMASLALSAWLGGYTPYAMKLGNLLVHLACGVALYGFLRRLLALDPAMGSAPRRFALAVTALWLLHPLHASTVLYAVQRMAQLATLFVLLGLWLYVAARVRLQRNPASPGAAVALLLGVPALTLLAVLSKENGALLPLLCATVEAVWFRGPRPRSVRWFLLVVVAVPVAGGLAYVALHPGQLSYAGRDFDMLQRVLSQPRALCDYLLKLVLPNPPAMGVYTDDFAVSTGLLSPPSTLATWLMLAGLTWLAWRMRARLPAASFGWAFFLVAHAMESTVFPLELYFEHRNYLPAVGVLLALVAIAVAAGRALAARRTDLSRIGWPAVVGVLAVLAFGAHGRALVWQDATLLAESSLRAHPHSLRANAAVLGDALRRGDRPRANQAIDAILASASPRDRALGHAFRLVVECANDGKARLADLDAFVDGAPMPLTRYELLPGPELFGAMGARPCPPLTDVRVGRGLVRLADRAEAHHAIHEGVRFQAAQFFVRGGALEEAVVQGRRAWTPKASPAAARPLLDALVRTGRLGEAQRVLDEARRRSDRSNRLEQDGLAWWQRHINDAAGKRKSSGQ